MCHFQIAPSVLFLPQHGDDLSAVLQCQRLWRFVAANQSRARKELHYVGVGDSVSLAIMIHDDSHWRRPFHSDGKLLREMRAAHQKLDNGDYGDGIIVQELQRVGRLIGIHVTAAREEGQILHADATAL